MAIRNNVVIVICDLCIRYTTMVDKYIPNVSACLKDPEPFIRKQTLIFLTNLLQVSTAPVVLLWWPHSQSIAPIPHALCCCSQL